MILKILAFVLIVIGAFISYGARFIVSRTGYASRIKINEAMELPSEEVEKYRLDKATVRVKMLGLLVLLPGVILIFITFR